MSQISAGLLMYRLRDGIPQVFLVHPGGPFWAKKDLGAWTLPKGLSEPEEDLLDAARREFREETGLEPSGGFIPLGSIKQKSGKTIHAWAFEGDCDPEDVASNTFEMEWPPKSGKTASFPEIDRAAWFMPDEALEKIIPGQRGFIETFSSLLGEGNLGGKR